MQHIPAYKLLVMGKTLTDNDVYQKNILHIILAFEAN